MHRATGGPPSAKRRYPNGADDPAGSITSLTTRGFTGREQLDQVALVHMNGRVGACPRAGAAGPEGAAGPPHDERRPTIPDAMNAQAWNRYSYVGNDPLTFTDPKGYSWLPSFFYAVTSFVSHLLANPIVRAIAQIVLTAVLTSIGVGTVAAAAINEAIVTGLSGGNLGQILREGPHRWGNGIGALRHR